MKKVIPFASLWNGKRDLLEAPKTDFMRLRNESTLNDDLSGDFHRDYLSIRWFFIGVERLSAQIPSAYVRMQSSTAVLR